MVALLSLRERGEIVESSIFEPSAFQEEIENFSSLMDDFFSFRSSNPTLKILYDEVKKIVQKRISSLDHVEKLIYKTGSVFYAFGKSCRKYIILMLHWNRSISLELFPLLKRI
jgi:hypothetical protein